MSKKLSTQEKARRMWVRALRSGKFRHTTGTLHNHDARSYCCLGVACVVAEKCGIEVIRNLDGGIMGTTLSKQPSVQSWLGLKNSSASFQGNDLTLINDRASRNPFKKIANLIEHNPEGLFEKDVAQ